MVSNNAASTEQIQLHDRPLVSLQLNADNAPYYKVQELALLAAVKHDLVEFVVLVLTVVVNLLQVVD